MQLLFSPGPPTDDLTPTLFFIPRHLLVNILTNLPHLVCHGLINLFLDLKTFKP